jgi:hypothetical protein
VLYQLGVDKVILPEKEMDGKCLQFDDSSFLIWWSSIRLTHLWSGSVAGVEEHTLIDLNLRVKI